MSLMTDPYHDVVDHLRAEIKALRREIDVKDEDLLQYRIAITKLKEEIASLQRMREEESE